uniref:Uncharacterized protein n=1 Tax=Arundo donax TaxID=35708 RepID=A0A0A8ZCM3_ARUDO
MKTKEPMHLPWSVFHACLLLQFALESAFTMVKSDSDPAPVARL